ncbi:putative glucan 1,3-beta-glucosidase [Planoprotostelium fungivorum]|uniref:glucan 1,3-beta-glucosidase n=1 Tax=Planoprotostelium fungivorum TaxID=1890364 RepID=A0A2P6NN89_9EUKA|nr:putative glucan 1,3-beta-glucosidase [Planoprotostelium fungivorum]
MILYTIHTRYNNPSLMNVCSWCDDLSTDRHPIAEPTVNGTERDNRKSQRPTRRHSNDTPNMRAVLLLAVVALAVAADSQCLQKRLNDVKSGKVPLRGGNLGSWFIQEGWMVPWLWSNNGCNAGQNPGTTKLEQCLGSRGAGVMQKHWSTFVTEADFIAMADNNLNAVRLPLGWWQIYDPVGGASKAQLKQHIEPTNYLTGALKYVDLAFQWGAKHGVGIIIDLHAAPGSQNGDDHSAPPAPGVQNWDKYPANVAQSLDSIELYAQRYHNKTAFLGFCLINEPKVNTNTLKKYYKDAYDRIRKHSSNSIVIINPLITNQDVTNQEWTSFMNPPQYNKVYMSMHWYHIWGFEGKSDAWKLNYIKNDRNNQVTDYLKKNPKPGVIDEWSCGGISNGRDAMQAQLQPFNRVNWIFWAWSKTSGGDNWSLRAAFEKGWINKSQTGVASC